MRQDAYNEFMAKKNTYKMDRLFLALSHETRLMLLHLLGKREVCVCELVDALAQPQPRISQHLACLRSVGIVEARREGKWMHYRIVPPPHPGAKRILDETLAWLGQEQNTVVTAASSGTTCKTAACNTQNPIRKKGAQVRGNA
jgi:ArsR family transcriptional regulator